ncbi:MAG TPA: 4Fe-4S dicluster domain-containing protein [Pseudonocardia sp.]|jgi:ferredoxin
MLAPPNSPGRTLGRRSGRRSNAWPVVRYRCAKERVVEFGTTVFGGTALRLGVQMRSGGGFGWLRYIPPLPPRLRRLRPPAPWPDAEAHPPAALRSHAATQVDPAAVEAAFARGRVPDFVAVHSESIKWLLRHSWAWLFATQPSVKRALGKSDAARSAPKADVPAALAPPELSRLIREEARRLGISQIGFTRADPRYTFQGAPDPGDTNIIVCVLEQDYAATQTAPSSRAERSAMMAYAALESREADLVRFILGLGYFARPNGFGSLEGIAIHYGEQAGLGQLGLNGQLLTPAAGSRARLALITTDAPVELGHPVDYGVPRLCDQCQLCVRRCPPGAIPNVRKPKRGVVKASIKPERCLPVVAQTHGCAVCMKVCPVQRYGLDAVHRHYERTGDILGKGSDELEGYVWPPDGRYYGPGEKPRITRELISPPGWPFDKDATGEPK